LNDIYSVMKKEEYIKQLLDKYLDGETSSAEERALRGYFTNRDNNIPEEWMPYRALFAYIAEERADAAETAPTADSNLNKARKTGRHGWIYTAITAGAGPRFLGGGDLGGGPSHTYCGGDDRTAAPERQLCRDRRQGVHQQEGG